MYYICKLQKLYIFSYPFIHRLKHWKDGEDVIETLSQELGIPEQAIQDEL